MKPLFTIAWIKRRWPESFAREKRLNTMILSKFWRDKYASLKLSVDSSSEPEEKKMKPIG